MREIIFRAWDKDKHEMRRPCGNMLISSLDGYPYWQFGHDDPEPMGDLILMQFTGLFDKLGNKIFEGDIVSTKFNPHWVERVYWQGPPDAIAEIFWDLNSFRLKAHGEKDNRFSDFFDIDEYNIGDMNLKHTEVIGNVWENPDLISSNTPSKKESPE